MPAYKYKCMYTPARYPYIYHIHTLPKLTTAMTDSFYWHMSGRLYSSLVIYIRFYIYIYTHMNTSLLSHVVSFTGLFWKSHTLPKLTTAMTDSEQVGYTGRLWFIYVSIDICKHVSFVTCRLFTGLFCKSLVIYTHLFRYLIGKSVSFPLSPCK